ncbi:T9SS type A sorting domain-containing protein [bacterium]|nr:MAG: T9SS type A sorting domain-containing protein [bacterium]
MKIFNQIAIAFILVLVGVSTGLAQTGYYRSVVAGSGNWSNTASWEYSADNISFGVITTEGYPGELGIPTSVLVRDGDTIVLEVSPANAIGALTVGEGASGVLSFGDDATVRTLTISNSVTIASGASASSASSAVHVLTIGDDLTVNGTFDGFTSGTQAINVNLTGAASIISGSGTIEFNTVTFNHTGTTTVSTNFSVQNQFSITNTGTVNLGTSTISGTGATDTFSMSTGTLVIGGTNTFPGGFETITLTGGTVHYAGLAQTVAHQESDGGPIAYNNIQISESVAAANAKTLGGNLDINGSLTLETGVDFNLGTSTINIAGSWVQNGTINYTVGTSHVVFDGAGFQQINNPINADPIEFYTFTASGGGIISIGAASTTYIHEDFSLTSNTGITSASNVYVRGDYSVASGSSYQQTAGVIVFDGSGAQNIDVNNSTFINTYFDNGAPSQKTLSGNLSLSGLFYVYNDADVTDAGIGQAHTLVNIRIDGAVNFQGTVMASGQIYDNIDNAIDFGTADLIMNAGQINTNNALTVHGDVTINSGTFNILSGASLTGNTQSFTVNSGAVLDIDANDGFPTGFSSYSLSPTSTVSYTLNGAQVVRGGLSYGELELGGGGTKTLDGAVTVSYFVDLNNAVTADFSTFTHTIRDRIYNNSGSTFTSSGTVNLFISDGANYELIDEGTYTFSNLVIDTDALTGSYIYDISADLTVNGNLTIQNSGGDAINIAVIDMNTYTYSNDGGDVLTVGDHLEIRTAGASSLESTVNSFLSNSFSSQSIVHYNGTTDQNVTNVISPYGALHFSGSGNRIATGALDVNGLISDRGGAFLFDLGTFTHNFAGDFSFDGDNTTIGTSTVIFDGGSQLISDVGNPGTLFFYNVTFAGTGTKTLDDNYNIEGTVTINPSITVDASSNDVDIYLAGDWTNNGTFTQLTGEFYFDGTGGNQNISNAVNSFGNVFVQKPSGVQQITLLNDLVISGSLQVNASNTFTTGTNDVYIGNDLTIQAGAVWDQDIASVLFFNGTTLQELNLLEPTSVFTNITFQNSGEKRNDNNALNVDGDLIIESGSTFNAGAFVITVAGDWTNNGSFTQTGSVQFDGIAQTINASTFNRVLFSNSGTKTLGGGITVTDDIIIDATVTLDVSASNYAITVGDDFTNNGTFNARNGLVTFNGLTGFLTTGGSSFYTVNFNKNAGQIMNLADNLDVNNNLSVSSGEVEMDGNDITLFGSLTIASGAVLDPNSTASDITFDGTSGSHTIQTSGNLLRTITVNASGASYSLADDLTLYANHSFTLTNGSFSLNTNTFSLQGTGDVIVNGGTFDIDENAILQIPNGRSITNNGGVFRVVGTAGNPARIQRNGATGGYTITQTSGTFHALYYEIFNTQTTGLTISGGSIDATNNFSNGTFSSGSGTQYLNVSGITITGIIADNVIFGSGPTYNVTRTSGTGVITFEDATGTLAGEAYENDGGSLIDWTFPAGIYWDGGGDALTWSDDLNWSGNTAPTSGSNVYLNHDFVGTTYSVSIDDSDAEANRVILDAQGGNPITLTITSGFDLTVTTSFQIGASTTVVLNDASSVLSIAESFQNAGTFTHTNGLLRFNGSSGSHLLNFGGSSVYNFEMDANGTTYTLASALDVNNDITLTDGTLNVSTSNFALTVGGDWTNVGLSTFQAQSGTVTFDLGGTGTQTISGGPFYNLTLTNGTGSGTATKQLTGNVDINNTVIINANTIFDAQTNNLYVGGNWTNNSSTGALTQSGTGSVTFDGSGNQTIDNGSFATTFNNLIITNTGTVTLAANSSVNGNAQVSFSTGTFNLSTFTLNGVGGSNSFTVSDGSIIQLYGSNFPSTFESIDLAANSTVQYRANSNQNVAAATYGNLQFLRSNAGNLQTKTALGDISVVGALTIVDTDTEFNLNGNTLTLTGNLSLPTGGRAIVWGGGTVEQNNTVDFNFDADITEWPSLVLSGSGTKDLFTNINVTGDITVQNGVNFRMDAFTVTGTGGVQDFTVDNGGQLRVRVPSATSVAFPTNFDTYGLGANSTVTIDASIPQTIYTAVTYGNLTLGGGSTATIDGDLYVTGNFTSGTATFLDNNFDLYFSGSDIQLNNYTASVGTKVTLDGTAQTLRESVTNTFNLQEIVFAGSGTKTLADNDTYDVNGNITVNPGVTVDFSRNMTFSGSTFTDNGTFNHTLNTITFDGAAQSIITNSSTAFYSLVFTNGTAKTFTTHGADINGNITIDIGASLNLGSFDYTLGYTGANFIVNGTLNAASANLTLDGANPDLPAGFTVNDLTLSTTGDVDMTGSIDVNGDLTIGQQLDVNNAAYTINIGGDFINNGIFNDFNGDITFDGANASVSIQSNGASFYNATFSPSVGTVYSLTSASNQIEAGLTIGANTNLDLNGKALTLGSNIAAGKTATVNGTLTIDDNSVLTIDNNNTAYSITVNGTLNMVGSALNIATLTSINQANTRRTALTVSATGTVHARYYLIEYLDNNGLVLTDGATVDGTNNFSDGSWTNIVTATGGPYYYLQTNSVPIGGTISNVSFGFSGTPIPATHYNVQRDPAAGTTITFGGTISGTLGGEAYEDDSGSKITWPAASSAIWTGSFNTDWNQAANWNTLSVPLSTTDVTIPLVTNNPRVTTANATCKDLTITNGALTLENGFDLAITGNLVIGTSTNAGALIVASSTSEIDIAGSWTKGSNGIFTNGSSTVTFNASSGSVTITPGTSAFNDVVFDGAATFILAGTILDFNGDITINSGVVNPSTGNYTITLAGDLNNAGGSINNVTNGLITLDGAAQAITGVTIDQLTVAGTGSKTFNGSNTINDNLIVSSTLVTAVGATLDINGTVTINTGGTFNNLGGGTHTVAGASWSNSGTYSGTGTINFDGGNQTINASAFAGLELSGTGVKTLGGNLTLSGDLTLRSTFTRLELVTYTLTHSGSGTMTVEGAQTIYVNGSNNFPSGFASYVLDATSNVYYRSTSGQTIRGGISYGNLHLNNANTKTLGGNIIVQTDITFNDATLDVSVNNYSINVGDDWNNQSTGSFIARLGDVTFDGSNSVDVQEINSSLSGTKSFYKLTVNKTNGSLRVDDQNLTVADNLSIIDGTFNPNNLQINIGGSLDNTGGDFSQSGIVVFTSTSGAENIRSNGSSFLDVTINGTGTIFTIQDNFTANGNFLLTAGTLDANGKTVTLGDGATDIVTIDGTLDIDANAILAIGNTVNITVNSGGTIRAVGTAGNPATVTRSITGNYAFLVNGTIHANNYVFEYMDASGIQISNSGTVDATNNFSNGTFTNGVASGTFLRIENTQTLAIDNISFPTNPGGAASNVTKVSSLSGVITLTNASGAFSGEVYDDDPNDLIDWPTPVILTWTGGTSTNWFTATNWSANSGPNIVPTGAEDVIIATATNQPIINTSGAITKNITINSGAVLTINTANETGNDFEIQGNLTLNGTLAGTSSSDTILVAGSWTRGGSGVFTPASGTVIFNGTSGAYTISNGGTGFYNFAVNATASYTLASNMLISNNLSIVSGTLDASASNYSISVGNTWTNAGTFTPRSGTVTFTRATAGTVNVNNGSSAFNNLTINGGASTIFTQNTNGLTINGNLTITNSTLDLNSLNLVMGDGTGSDILTVNGTIDIDANAQLKMGASSTIQVQSGGVFRVVGSDESNIATITRNSTGTYTFIASSGSTVHARYYALSYMGANGIQIQSGATINAVNNFSDGTFSNGTSGGRYLEIISLGTNHIASNVTFNSGPTKNVRATSGTGNYIEFEDATGLLSGPAYEDDDASATTGAVRWSSTSTIYTWTGASNTDWNTLANWDDGIGVPLSLPDASIDVVIPNVANDPIISAADANANNLTIQSGGVLVINSNRSLTLASSFTNGGTLTISNGSTSTLSVGNNYSNSGTVTFGNASTVEFTAATGIKSLAFGGSSLNNLTLNGAATFNLTSNLDVNGNLTISAGVLDVTTSNYQINVAGNWTNSATFTSRSGRVIFDGSGAQNIDGGGLTSDKRFYNLRIAKSNTATFTSDIYVLSSLELISGSLNLGTGSIETTGTWSNTNVTIVPSTSTVVFSGSSSTSIAPNTQSFNNVTVNKTGGNQVSLTGNTTINGVLTVTAGTFYLNGRRLNYGDGADAMSITGTLYIDAGAILGMHQNASAVVNSGGVLRVTGSNASNVATVTRQATTAGWQMTVNGELRAQFALFEYSGGDGITLGATATLNATQNLSNTTFQNGIGASYVTNNAPITSTLSQVTINAGPTYNFSATDGAISFDNYTGTLAGSRFENDGGADQGYLLWAFNGSQSIAGIGTYNFGNEVVVNVTGIAGLTDLEVDLRNELYESDYNALPRYYRLIYTGGTATGDITFGYSESELGTINESNLRVWVHKGGLVWANLGGVVDEVNNTITVSGYTLGEGTAAETMNKANPNNPNVLDGSEDFLLSDENSQASLPVELTRFEVIDEHEPGLTKLEWETATETENYGFYLSRTYIGSDNVDLEKPTMPRDTTWIELAFVEGAGNSVEKQVYSFEDGDVQEAGKYLYRLIQMDFDGKTTAYDPIEFLYTGPETFSLKNNYPNPFNPVTVIPYDVAERTAVRIEIFNVLGQRVSTLVNEVKNPGTYKIEFRASGYASGVYIVRYSAQGRSFVKKMLLVK